MSLTINTNIQALDAQRNLNNTENSLAMSMERLSSGLKINSAADDVAGYAINQRLQSQINGLEQAQQNSQDAVALAQTAQGALNEVGADAPARPRARRAVRKRHQLESDKEPPSKARSHSSTKRSSESAKRRRSTASRCSQKRGEITFQVGANEGKEEKIAVNTIKLSETVKAVKLSEARKHRRTRRSKSPKSRSRPANSARCRTACSTRRRTSRRLHAEPVRCAEFDHRRQHGV